MKTITFHCETITPMFLAGADGTTPELRPPSIKGAMRFWWRAINGHLVIKKTDGTWDYTKLKEEEAKIFGGHYKTENGTDVSLKSSIILNVSYLNEDIKVGEDYKEQNHLETHFDKDSKGLMGNDIGISYLLYSTIVNKRKYIAEGSKFTILLSFKSNENIDSVIKAFWLLTFFGGIGARSRRGAGSYFISDIKGEFNLKDWFVLQQKDADYQGFYSSKLEQLAINIINDEKNYSVLSSQSLIIGNKKSIRNNSRTILNRIGKLYYDFRTSNRGSIFLLNKGNFGLPIMSSATKEEIKPEHCERRSSSIYISIFPLLEKNKIRLNWSIILLQGTFLDDNESILRLKNTGNEKIEIERNMPSNNIVQSFINSIRNE